MTPVFSLLKWPLISKSFQNNIPCVLSENMYEISHWPIRSLLHLVPSQACFFIFFPRYKIVVFRKILESFSPPVCSKMPGIFIVFFAVQHESWDPSMAGPTSLRHTVLVDPEDPVEPTHAGSTPHRAPVSESGVLNNSRSSSTFFKNCSCAQKKSDFCFPPQAMLSLEVFI